MQIIVVCSGLAEKCCYDFMHIAGFVANEIHRECITGMATEKREMNYTSNTMINDLHTNVM